MSPSSFGSSLPVREATSVASSIPERPPRYLGFARDNSWFYKTGWAVTFYGDSVDRIAIFRGGSKRFDRTGYDCEFTSADYQRKYGMKTAPDGFPRPIAEGEYIYMDEHIPCQYVVLTIYNN